LEDKIATIKELELEAASLELEEKAAKLRLIVIEKRESIAKLTLKTKDRSSCQEQRVRYTAPPTTDEKTSAPSAIQQADINLGEFYSEPSSSNKLPFPPDVYSQPCLQPSQGEGYGYTPESGYNSERLDLNPQSYLYTPDNNIKSKHRAILDFIPTTARTTMEDVSEHEIAPGWTLTTGRQTKLESVTPAQWVAANACILADIIRKSAGKINVQ
jgi:hypothetical protein